MKLHDVTALAVKIAGLVLLVILLSKIPEYVQSFASVEKSQYTISSLYYILPLLIVGIACLVLIFLPYKISNNLLFNSEVATNDSDSNNLQIIAIRLLGLLLLFWSVSDAVFHLFNYLLLRNLADTSFQISAYNYPLIIATGVEIVIAVIFLKNAKNISAYLHTVCK